MAKMKSHIIRIYNASKQTISLQVRPPNGDFFTSEQQARLNPGRTVDLPKSFVLMDQITNLQSRGLIKVTYDSEAAAERNDALNS